MSASTRPWGLEYAANTMSAFPETLRVVGQLALQKAQRVGPVKRSTPKWRKRPDGVLCRCSSGYEMGTRSWLSTHYRKAARSNRSDKVVMHLRFLANFHP